MRSHACGDLSFSLGKRRGFVISPAPLLRKESKTMVTAGILIILLFLIICAMFIPGQRGVCKWLALAALVIWCFLVFKSFNKF